MCRCAGCLPPCRSLAGPRSTRVDFSMGTMNRCISFRPHLTRRMSSADTARQLRVPTFDHSTSTTTNRPPDQHFYPISVVRVDGKWVRGWNSVTAGRPAHSPGVGVILGKDASKELQKCCKGQNRYFWALSEARELQEGRSCLCSDRSWRSQSVLRPYIDSTSS